MPEILFPVLTGLTLVFAGILVGYFLWFRDRSEQLILSENLATENERLAAELRAKTSKCVEHEDNISRLGLKTTSLEQLCDDLLKSREKVQLQTTDLESELISARKKLEEMRDQMSEECRLRSKSEENLLGTKQQYVDALAKMELDWKDKFANSQNTLYENNSEVARLTSANEQLAERLHSAQTEVAELKSELGSQREILETAKTNAVGLEKEYVTLETSMRSQIELLSEARGQTAAAISAKKLAEEAREQHREQVSDLQSQIHELQAQLRQYEKIEDRCTHLESSMEVSKERIEAITAKRDEAEKSASEYREQISTLQPELQELQSRLRTLEQLEDHCLSLEAELEGSKERIELMIAQRDAADKTASQFQEQTGTLQSQLQALQSQLGSFGQVEQRCAGLESAVEASKERLEMLIGQRDEALDQRNDFEQELLGLRKRSENQQATITQLRDQASENDKQSKQYSEGLLNQVQQLESANRDLIAECGQLTQQFTDSEQRQQRHEDTLKRISEENAQLLARLQELENEDRESKQFSDEYQIRIDSVLQQRDMAYEEVEHLKAQVRRVRKNAKSNEETIRILRRERGQILMRNRQITTPSFPRIHDESLGFTSKADQLAQEYGGKIESDPVRGLLFSEAPSEVDDLKLIYGVAEILEQRLNGFGIYTFKQIMEWDEKAIDEFSELLTFKDRIHRDDWLGQAATLYYQKKNRRAVA